MERRPVGGRSLTTGGASAQAGLLDLLTELGVAVPIRHAVSRTVQSGQTASATAAQSAALPEVVSGHNLLTVAPTGSGKTLLLAVAAAQRLSGSPSKPGRPRALVIAPTRELVNQVAGVIGDIGASVGLRMETVVGGTRTSRDRSRLAGPVDVVAGTPGRLGDLVRQGALDLSQVSLLLLDEADQLFSLGFAPQVNFVLSRCPARPGLVATTATASLQTEEALRTFAPNLSVLRTEGSGLCAENPSTLLPARQVHYLVDSDPESRVAALAPRLHRALAFVGRRDGTDRLRAAIENRRVTVAAVHSGATPARRAAAFAQLAAGTIRVLVTTDLSGRGLDFDAIAEVIHVGVPRSSEDLVHRSGRTGRGSQAAGTVLVVVTSQDVARLRALAAAAQSRLALTEVDLAGAESLLGPEVIPDREPRRRTAPSPHSRRPGGSRPHRPKRKRDSR